MSTPTPPACKIHHEQHFESLQALLDHINNAESPLPDNSRSSRDKERGNWAGADSFETVLTLAQFGWEEGLKKIKLLTKEITPKFYEIFPRQDSGEELKHDVGGAYEDPVVADIGADPADMINFKAKFDEIKPGNSLQRLIIETGVSSNITPETMFLRGACILALLESLETYGFRIEVILQCTINASYSGDNGKSDLVIFRTTLKTFEEHSDYDKFAYCIANAAFLRRLMFSSMECLPLETIDKFNFRKGGNYSFPHNHPIYMDPDRDFYMVRVLENKTLVECMTETVELINKRYKGFIQTVENPELEKGSGGSEPPKDL